MRKLSKTLPALLALILSSNFLFAQWQTYQTQVNKTFSEVSVVSPSVIWACGQNGTVVKSTNGGENWVLCSGDLDSGKTIQHITAIDVNLAWITTAENQSKIYKTTNGGLNWVQQVYNSPYWINKIHFFNANTGIFLRDPLSPPSNDTVGFFITRNGGANWYRSQNTPRATILCDCCMGILDSNLVWFADNDKVYKLTGGLDNPWQVYSVPVTSLYTARFINTTTGYTSDGLKLFKSTNGGINWAETMSNFNCGALSFIHVPNSNMMVASNQGYIRISYDLGNSWQPTVATGFGTFYSGAYDTNSIWIAANNGKLIRYNIGYIGINLISSELPAEFRLYQNYPNPFNPVTSVKFDLPVSGVVSFIVYDLLGKELYGIFEERKAGHYEIKFDGSELSSGVYYYTLKLNNYIETKKMVLIK